MLCRSLALRTDTCGHFADNCPWTVFLRTRAFGHSGQFHALKEAFNARVRVYNLSITLYLSKKQQRELGKAFNGTDTFKKVSELSVLPQAHMFLAGISGGASCRP